MLSWGCRRESEAGAVKMEQNVQSKAEGDGRQAAAAQKERRGNPASTGESRSHHPSLHAGLTGIQECSLF